MRTAASIPGDLFRAAELLASRTDRSRSDVYSAALRGYVARHDPDEVLANVGEFYARADGVLIGETDSKVGRVWGGASDGAAYARAVRICRG
jgi:predicted transcriptional regulator